MREYIVGIEDHYAWANLVSVAISAADETLLDKRRVELLDPALPSSPYHGDTLRLPAEAAEKLVRDVRASANARASSALSALLTDLAPARCRGIAIRTPPLPHLPTSVAEAHANTQVTNRADGMIYHHALTSAAAQLDLPVFHFDKTTVLTRAAESRGTTPEALEQRLKSLRAAHGPPWQKGHVIACAGAILAHMSLRTGATAAH
jgi:hypothetical protein